MELSRMSILKPCPWCGAELENAGGPWLHKRTPGSPCFADLFMVWPDDVQLWNRREAKENGLAPEDEGQK